VPRRIFGLKTEDVTGEWRKLHNVELHYLVLFTKYRIMMMMMRLGKGETCRTLRRRGVIHTKLQSENMKKITMGN
jgi:hypothetical protein